MRRNAARPLHLFLLSIWTPETAAIAARSSHTRFFGIIAGSIFGSPVLPEPWMNGGLRLAEQALQPKRQSHVPCNLEFSSHEGHLAIELAIDHVQVILC